MPFQSSEDTSKLLCLLISAVLESCEFGLGKSLEKIFLSPQEKSICAIGGGKFTSKQEGYLEARKGGVAEYHPCVVCIRVLVIGFLQ